MLWEALNFPEDGLVMSVKVIFLFFFDDEAFETYDILGMT